ncbi:MAG: T9SS type A sorting domain-containing protein [Bacteroidota bacterium]
MKILRLVMVVATISRMIADNPVYAQWETVLTDIIPAGIFVSPDYANDRTVFILDNNRILWRSTNEGFTWTKLLIADNLSIPELLSVAVSPSFSEDGTLLVIKNNGEVKKSVDFGLTWSLLLNIPGNVTALAFTPENDRNKIIYALTGNNAPQELYFSEDTGESWQLVQSISSSGQGNTGLWISSEPSSGESLAIQSDKTLYITHDGGHNIINSFNQVFETGLSDVVFSPGFSNDSILFASDWKNIWKNDKGGDPFAWTVSSLQFTSAPVKLAISPAFTTDHIIYATSSEKVVKRSLDGGMTWENFGSTLNLTTSHIAISNTVPYTLFLGLINDDSTSGKILRSGSINATEDRQFTTEVICYPNPARHSVNISFTLKMPGNISISIYNPTGNEIGSFNCGHFGQGSHRITLPLTGSLSVNGLYFCRLQTGDETETFKLAIR